MTAQSFIFRSAPSLKELVALLESASLPTSDLTEAHLPNFFCCGPRESPQGFAGVEIYGTDALLRSVVVRPTSRASGIGTALVSHLESHARQRGVHSMYLLTTTAERFFERLGYQHIDREDAPSSIRSTREFALICPASSALMTKPL
jgi:amino-acid N-acetyltransferase